MNFEMDEDSAVLAWQASVATRLAASCETVEVLTERSGRVSVPGNMHVETIPRRPMGIPKRYGGSWLLNAQAIRLCRRYRIQVCFVHMAMEWAYHLYPAMRALGIPILLWYAHGTVTNRLRLAHACVDRVVTSTAEGFRIPSDKCTVIGQGVDTDLFMPPASGERADLVYVGRVSRRKRVDLLVRVIAEVRALSPGAPIRLRIVGPMLTAEDLAYDRELRVQVWELGLERHVTFEGFVPQAHVPSLYSSAFLHINLSQTGSMDKTVLEALACGCPVLTSNAAAFDLLNEHPECIVRGDNPREIAAGVLEHYAARENVRPAAFRELIVGAHDLDTHARRLQSVLEGLIK